ncbi:MAG: hypothetical protein H6712_34555 [Myxococcales bacterium]|nr:hypothetical protein [Myxococcales bacterium]
MSSKHGVLGMMVWAMALGLPACDSDGDPGGSGAGSTGEDVDASTGDMQMDGDSTGRPTPIPPDTGMDSSGGDDMGDGSTGDEPPVELGCAEYCGLYMDACQDFSEYANEQHCMDHCAQWPLGEAGDVDGDSLGCRSYHVTVAGSTDPELHCPHAGPSGMHVCVDEGAPSCELYCTRYFNNCEGELNLWDSMDACMETCAGWYPGTATDTSGHTIGCRAYYANLAAGDADTHCGNAGPGGGEMCVLGG